MREQDWPLLAEAWRDIPHDPTPVIAELNRIGRRRWVARLSGIGEVMIGATGIVASVWFLLQGQALVGGLALAFVLVVSGLSIWSRCLAPPDEGDTILAATAAARRNAALGVRYANATLWAVCAGSLFVGLLTLLGFGGWVPEPAPYAVGLAVLWLSGWLAGGIIHLRSRSQDLRRLEVLYAALVRDEQPD